MSCPHCEKPSHETYRVRIDLKSGSTINRSFPIVDGDFQTARNKMSDFVADIKARFSVENIDASITRVYTLDWVSTIPARILT